MLDAVPRLKVELAEMSNSGLMRYADPDTVGTRTGAQLANFVTTG